MTGQESDPRIKSGGIFFFPMQAVLFGLYAVR